MKLRKIDDLPYRLCETQQLKRVILNVKSKDKFEGQILHKQSYILNIINAQTNTTFSLKGYFHKHFDSVAKVFSQRCY